MLTTLLRFIGLRQLAQKSLRTTLTIFGIALGVGLFVAIQAINDSTLEFFRENVTALTGQASITVLGGETGFPEEKVDLVKAVPGVKAAVPTIETRARFEGASGRVESLSVLGIDFLQESAVRGHKGGEAVIDDPLEFLNLADSIVVTKAFAEQHGLAIESPFSLQTAHGKKRFVIRGMLAGEGVATAYGGGIAIMDIDGARQTFGKEGKVDRIDVVPEDGADESALVTRIEKAIGSGLRVERKENQSEAFGRMVKGYQSLLSFLSSLALLVGVFLVANTVTLAVSERRREVGILRVLGTTRAGILFLFVGEAAVLGLIGGAIGVFVGRGLAEVLVSRVSESMSRQYVTPIDVTEIHFQVRHVMIGLVAGTLSSVIAALLPAWRASRVRAADAFAVAESGAIAAAAERRAKVARTLGIAMLAALFVCAHFRLSAHFPVIEPVYPVLGGLGTALAAPFFVTAGLRMLAASGLLSRMSVLRLSCENLLLNPSRTGSNVLSLVAGLMLVIVMGTVHKSFERSIGEWQERTFRTDLVVSSSGRVLSLEVQPLADEIAAEIDRIPGVDVQDGHGARAIRIVRQSYDGREIALKALDRPHPRLGFAFLDVLDRPADQAGRDLYDASEPTVLVSEGFAAHFGKRTGQTLELDTPNGRTAFRIVGVLVDYGHPDGVVYISRETYKRLWNDSLATAFAVEAAPGVSHDQLRAAIDASFADRGIVATMNRQLRKQLEDVLGESLAYTRAIEAAALAVGLLGLMSTLLMSLVERMRELGMLRAIGMSRFQLVRMVVGEAVLLGCFGGAVAAGLGAFVAHLWVVSTLATSLGWTITVHVPWSAVLSTLAAGIAVGVIAGLLSSRRVAFVSIREALSV